ncbi:DsbA family protein [Neoehrlichia mikurensis]|uniref:DsbA family protein n=1 Tax=Neoehrlichia mikurensis TaxID=89586 RepID=A0A9Q9C1C2_9RICK|nr:DsbA family protein [Neoehrlichia mikurensis]QXK91685.1 DsbA family protein [Neoehrlichia mikurensis]QXK92896.1 DsbA family protein [Neoehrlichia mikurensis]QXK93376.1 DsbA family protein [Neoehrlichia mikurensis]UTO55679.1 DsbA family protein [Neoehrlichia mikurensis]UTO56597.1 DsbA family protein [Neoehrlichia mikurensis]
MRYLGNCIIILLLVVALVYYKCDVANASSSHTSSMKHYSDRLVKLKDSTTAEELLGLMPHDRFLGNKKAPVVIIEYASFSCMHCASFILSVLPKIEDKYIKTGKLLYIYRNFPLDYVSLKAAMLGLCYDSNESFFTYSKAVFSSIEALVRNYKDLTLLSNIAKISNISDERFNKCMNDEHMMDYIIQDKLLASNKLQVMATPTFFINGKKYDKAHDFESFSRVIDEIIMLHPNYSVAQ